MSDSGSDYRADGSPELDRQTVATAALLAAERSVLGALMLHGDALADVQFLREQDFYLVQHQIIYAGILAARASGRPTDPLVVAEVLLSRDRLAEAGGYEQLLDLWESVVTAAGVEHHAQIVREHSHRRELANIGREIGLLTREGGDVAEVVATFGPRLDAIAKSIAEGPNRATAKAKPYRLRSINEIRALPPAQWLVDALVPAPSVGFVISQPNTGKTALVIGWMLSAFYSRPWCGRTVQPGSVVLVAGEGVPGLRRRLDAWERDHAGGHSTDSRYFEVLDSLPPLASPAGTAALSAAVDELAERHGHAPAMVAIDTLASLWGGESEDRSEFAGPTMAALGRIAERHGIAIILVHHTSKPNADRGSGLSLASLRGSSAFGGAADFVLAMEPTPDGARLLTLKQKDAERAAPIVLRLHKVDLGQDEQGRSITGVYYVPGGDHEQPGVDRVAAERAAQQAAADARVQLALDVLKKMGGSTSSKEALAQRMAGKTVLARAAVATAIDRGLIAMEGTARSPIYRLTATGACVCAPPNNPQGQDGTAQGPPTTVPVEGDDEGTTEGRRDGDQDHGMPKQPGGRRRHRSDPGPHGGER